MKTNSGLIPSKTRFPILQGILPIQRSQIPLDVVAGITLAAVSIPEVMGYTSIARMPVIMGLYTILIPLFLYAVFGASRHLVVGADSATAVILASALVSMAQPASSRWVVLAGMLALMTGVWLLIARIVKLGFIADFLSRSVLIGFLTGIGIQVAISQIPQMLGVHSIRFASLQGIIPILREFAQVNLISVGISMLGLMIILAGKRVSRRVPGALIAVVAAIVVSYFMNLQAYHVPLIGAVQGGLPPLQFPQVGYKDIPPLFGVSLSMFIVILAQSAATSRAYAMK